MLAMDFIGNAFYPFQGTILCINSTVLMVDFFFFYRQVDPNVVIFENFIFQLKYAHLKHTALNKNKDERRLFHHMFQSLLLCDHFMLSSQWLQCSGPCDLNLRVSIHMDTQGCAHEATM